MCIRDRQWCMCMFCIDLQISKIKVQIKSFVIRKTSKESNADENYMVGNNTFNQADKNINLENIDNAVNAFRTASQSHLVFDEYFGVFIACHMSLLAYWILSNSYRLWICFAKYDSCSIFSYYLLFTIEVCDFISIVTVTTISTYVGNKVKI